MENITDLFQDQYYICPNCENYDKVVRESLEKYETQTCSKCRKNFNIFDLIDYYEKIEPFVKNAFKAHRECAFEGFEIGCSDKVRKELEELLDKIELETLVRRVAYLTAKYGNTYLKPHIDKGTFNEFEILDTRIVRIETDWGRRYPSQKSLELIPTKYYEIKEEKREFKPREIIHITNEKGILSNDLYGDSIIRICMGDIATYQMAKKVPGSEKIQRIFLRNIVWGTLIPWVLLERLEGVDIPFSLHSVGNFLFSLRSVVRDFERSLSHLFSDILGEDSRVRIKIVQPTERQVLKKFGYDTTGHDLEIISNWKKLFEMRIISKEKFEEIMKKYKPT